MYDLHTHFLPSEVLSWIEENRNLINAKWEKKSPNKEDFLVINEKWAFELKEAFTNTSIYLQNQSEAGIRHSLISPIPQLFLYDFPSEVTKEMASVYNDSLANLVHSNSKNLSALATVPLNHPIQAATELKRSMKLGLKGAIIGPGCSGHMLTDDFFTPFWEEANKQKAILFIHPLLNDDSRLKGRKMTNLIGVPWETTICATDLLLAGFLDKYPNVKILLAHGGGFLPYQIGRLDKGYEEWSMVSDTLKTAPSKYLSKFWYDTVLWDPKALAYLIDLVGEDRIVPGSDFPFDLSTWPPSPVHSNGVNSLLND